MSARARATIDRDALRHNLALLRTLAPGRSVIGVVKADAYGHGVGGVARSLVAAGCERLAVVTVAELEELRAAGVAVPVLLLGPLASGAEAQRAADCEATLVLHGDDDLALAREAAADWQRAGRATPLPLHIEVDTGMRRMGVPAHQAVAFAERVASEAGLHLEGLFTHFACADAPDLAPTLEQSARFREVLRGLRERRVAVPLVHASNSAGVLAGSALRKALPEENAIRPGLALYGVRPAAHLGAGLRPVMTLRARVVRLHTLAAGESVGYGSTWRAERATRVATLGIGYADGVPWTAANRGRVWLAGAERAIVGRVSMDYVSAEIGDARVAVGDEAIVFGRDAQGAGVPVEEAAVHDGAFDYELLVRVGRRVPREFVGAEARA